MTAEHEAWFQGNRLRLDLNAAAWLRAMLDRLAHSEPSGIAALTRLDVRLRDGRPLRLSVRLTDASAIRHQHGAYQISECVAYVDVSGDFDNHVAARQVIDGATRPYLEVPRSDHVAAALDAARVHQALDGRAPTADALNGEVRDAVRARAQRAADQTRTQRIADVVRRSWQLGLEWGPMTRREHRRRGRQPSGHGPRAAALAGPLGVALHRNARVWVARRLAAPRWTWCSSVWRAGAGGR